MALFITLNDLFYKKQKVVKKTVNLKAFAG